MIVRLGNEIMPEDLEVRDPGTVFVFSYPGTDQIFVNRVNLKGEMEFLMDTSPQLQEAFNECNALYSEPEWIGVFIPEDSDV